VGDVAYENQGNAGAECQLRTQRGADSTRHGRSLGIQLHDLPQTRNEVQGIGKLLGQESVILLGNDATETAFKKEPLDQFRILHLAVHGFADTQYPERSALVLGKDQDLATTVCCKYGRS